MEYNAPPGSQDREAPYVNGIPGVKKGSPVNAQAVEYPQREIVNVIKKGGLIPSNENLEQLYQAILAIVDTKLPGLATTKKPGLVQPDGVTISITAGGVISVVEKAQERYELCDFYAFRHPTLKPGFQPAHGGLLANAPVLYPRAWEYLQTVEGQKLCVTEAAWQAMTTAIFHTNADGTKVGWNGIGGAPFYVQDVNAGTLRMPDLRGMFLEASGFDALGVGGVHGDGERQKTGKTGFLIQTINGVNAPPPTGMLYAIGTSGTGQGGNYQYWGPELGIDTSRVAPTASKTQPRAWGALACVYLGQPASL